MSEEIWKPVVGFEEWYEVSDAGRVIRIAEYKSTRVGRVLKNQVSVDGYHTARLSICGKAFHLGTISRVCIGKTWKHVGLRIRRAK